MHSEKKGLKSRIGLGLLILTPLCLLLYLAVAIFKIFGAVSYELLLGYVWPNSNWLVAAFSGLAGFLILALILGSIYYSKRTGLSRFVDKFMLSIPVVKIFWHAEKLRHENQTLDFSKIRAAIIKTNSGVWQLVFLMGKQGFEQNKMQLTRAVYPTVPLPFTSFFYFIDEEELRRENKVIYLKNSASQLFQIYFSFGFVGPELLEIKN